MSADHHLSFCYRRGALGRHRIVGIVAPIGLLLAACQAQLSPTSMPTETLEATASSSAHASLGPNRHVANGKILFNRVADDEHAGAFTIEPDGTGETKVADLGCISFSSDGSAIGCIQWFDYGGRPALASGDGSGIRVLDPDPGTQRSLQCGLFDDTRFVCGAYAGDFGPPIRDRGLHLVSATDGAEILQLSKTPDGCDDTDVVPSPDRTAILFNRSCNDHGVLNRIDIHGNGLTQLSPSDVSNMSSSSTDLAFAKPDADWSPDGSLVAYGAFTAAALPGLFVVHADGTQVRQIVSTDVGAVTVAWSPDGDWIAFTSRYRLQPQVWLVHPDGSGLVKLTDGSGGTVSVGPIWSPDGTKLLFARGQEVGGQILTSTASLWTMNADGTNQTKLVDLPNADSAATYDWGPAADD